MCHKVNKVYVSRSLKKMFENYCCNITEGQLCNYETHVTFRAFIMAVKRLKSYKCFYKKFCTIQTSFNENFCLTVRQINLYGCHIYITNNGGESMHCGYRARNKGGK
jgi:hypothetical protein